MRKQTLVVGSALAAMVFATATLQPTETAAAPKRNSTYSYAGAVTVGAGDLDSRRGPRIKAAPRPR